MKLHLVALPHTTVSPEFCGCAYTAKVLKFCKMMGDHYSINLYAPEGPPVQGATLIPCISDTKRQNIFGKDDSHRLPAWPTDEQTLGFNASVIQELTARKEPHDLILLTGGWTHKAIADAFPNHIICEPGVGYEGIFTDKCAFESYAWQHYVYGKKGIINGRWFDTVIPNYFDPEDFREPSRDKGDYLLYVGRLIERKGVHIASQIAEAVNMKLIVVGAGGKQVGKDIVADEVTIKNAEYVGPVGIAMRAVWMQRARALICPTTYIEPFGGVAVEAMIAGTPVLATDFGAFVETVETGKTGFRFRTMKEALEGLERCLLMDPIKISTVALNKYSLEAVAPQFQTWFTKLSSLWGDGWYAK